MSWYYYYYFLLILILIFPVHSFLIQLYLLQFKKLTKINIFCLLRNVDVKLTWPMGKHPGWVRLCWAGELCPDQLLFGKQKKNYWEKNRTESYFRGARLKSQTCTQRIRVGGILGFADMPYPWFSPTARAIIIPRGCGRACWAAEKCKKKKRGSSSLDCLPLGQFARPG